LSLTENLLVFVSKPDRHKHHCVHIDCFAYFKKAKFSFLRERIIVFVTSRVYLRDVRVFIFPSSMIHLLLAQSWGFPNSFCSYATLASSCDFPNSFCSCATLASSYDFPNSCATLASSCDFVCYI